MVGGQVEVVHVIAEMIEIAEDPGARVHRQLEGEAALRLVGARVHPHFHDALPHRTAVAVSRDVPDRVKHQNRSIPAEEWLSLGVASWKLGVVMCRPQLSKAISIG